MRRAFGVYGVPRRNGNTMKIGLIVGLAMAFMMVGCPAGLSAAEAPRALSVASMDFGDLKQLNNGEPVLLPGIAAETKSMAVAWDTPAISNAMANTDHLPLVSAFVDVKNLAQFSSSEFGTTD